MLSSSECATRWMRVTESDRAGKSLLWRMRRSRKSSVALLAAVGALAGAAQARRASRNSVAPANGAAPSRPRARCSRVRKPSSRASISTAGRARPASAAPTQGLPVSRCTSTRAAERTSSAALADASPAANAGACQPRPSSRAWRCGSMATWSRSTRPCTTPAPCAASSASSRSTTSATASCGVQRPWRARCSASVGPGICSCTMWGWRARTSASSTGTMKAWFRWVARSAASSQRSNAAAACGGATAHCRMVTGRCPRRSSARHWVNCPLATSTCCSSNRPWGGGTRSPTTQAERRAGKAAQNRSWSGESGRGAVSQAAAYTLQHLMPVQGVPTQ